MGHCTPARHEENQGEQGLCVKLSEVRESEKATGNGRGKIKARVGNEASVADSAGNQADEVAGNRETHFIILSQGSH